jgi:hypothetical protein
VFSCLSSTLSQSINDVDFWNIERPKDMANLASLEVMCGKTHMEVQVSFDRPFNGIIFSKGAVDQYNCIYVKPQTGSIAYSFNILYDQVLLSLLFILHVIMNFSYHKPTKQIFIVFLSSLFAVLFPGCLFMQSTFKTVLTTFSAIITGI